MTAQHLSVDELAEAAEGFAGPRARGPRRVTPRRLPGLPGPVGGSARGHGSAGLHEICWVNPGHRGDRLSSRHAVGWPVGGLATVSHSGIAGRS